MKKKSISMIIAKESYKMFCQTNSYKNGRMEYIFSETNKLTI
jgi:hypothetical protein